MDTIRELIIKNIVTRAAIIRITVLPVLYATDCGETVFRARPKVDPDDLPCTIVWPQPEEAENIHGSVCHHMPVRIEGIAKFGSDEPSVVSERILGDLIRCFTSPSWSRSPDYIESIIYQGGGTDEYPEDGSVTVGASATFLVTYWTAIGDPCTQ
jgi:hypothetical protein